MDSFIVHEIAQTNSSNKEKQRLIKMQLGLIIHASRCKFSNYIVADNFKLSSKDIANENPSDICLINNCSLIKRVLLHHSNCNLGRLCKEQYCFSTRQIITHWHKCLTSDCPICAPFFTVNSLNEIKSSHSQKNDSILNIRPTDSDIISQDKQLNYLNELSNMPKPHISSAYTALGLPPPVFSKLKMLYEPTIKRRFGREKKMNEVLWQSSLTKEKRTELIQKIVLAIFPLPLTPEMLRDHRMGKLLAYVTKFEADMYEDSNSMDEYNHLLACKIYRIQIDLEEKRKKKVNYLTDQEIVTQKHNEVEETPIKITLAELNSCQPNIKEQSSNDDLCINKFNIKTVNFSENIDLKEEIKTTNLLENLSLLRDKIGSENLNAIQFHTSKKHPPTNLKIWNAKELSDSLMPVLDKLYQIEPESLAFQQPVDPVLLQIPDYYDVVKKPMDLSTIKQKLELGLYKDPWQMVDDVWLMFENAWLYNRKSSKVHKYCTKLSEVFEQAIDIVMQQLGYCCGRKYVFCPQVLCCYGKPMCTIAINAVYYSFQNRYVYCDTCFTEIQGEMIELIDDPLQPSTLIRKDLFVKTKNSELDRESFAECTSCSRKLHEICSLHFEQIWPNNFICSHCIHEYGLTQKPNKFTSKNLPQTKIGAYLENRVNSFLRSNRSGAGIVTIRVLSSSEKYVEVKPGMKARCCRNEDQLCEDGILSERMPYIAKSIFAYEEINGVDVCFFGMHVQEYNSQCPAPNSRRVYIAYLDSVNFFQPRVYRTAVYHEILIGYLDYVKNLGYLTAHIWACPPSEGDDYIFHCHPPDMKIPKPKRLVDWYKKMLDKAIIERVVIDYKDILKDSLEIGLQKVAELPYFEGDFWPNILEGCINELEQEKLVVAALNDAMKGVAMDTNNDDVHQHIMNFDTSIASPTTQLPKHQDCKGKVSTDGVNKKKSKHKSTPATKKTTSKMLLSLNSNDLTAKLFQAMEKHKEVFFVVRLRSMQEACNFASTPILDPDPLLNCELTDGRDAFLLMSRERHYEFSSLRRAMHSTMAMLYELHAQYNTDKFETHLNCTFCEGFELCTSCSSNMSGSCGTEAITTSNSACSTELTDVKKQSLQRCVQSLLHASTCQIIDCNIASCRKMKSVMAHARQCLHENGGCSVCKQLIALCCYHARHCDVATKHFDKCPVPFCYAIRQKMLQQQQLQRQQQALMMRRRMAAMQMPSTSISITNQSQSYETPTKKSSFSLHDDDDEVMISRQLIRGEAFKELSAILRLPRNAQRQQEIIMILKQYPKLLHFFNKHKENARKQQ